MKKTGAKFPIGWDDGNAISQRYKLEKMPTSYIVDRKGIIRFVHGGYGDSDADEDRARSRRALALTHSANVLRLQVAEAAHSSHLFVREAHSTLAHAVPSMKKKE